jgi:D-alanine transaminase
VVAAYKKRADVVTFIRTRLTGAGILVSRLQSCAVSVGHLMQDRSITYYAAAAAAVGVIGSVVLVNRIYAASHTPQLTVYLDGKYVPHSEARIHVDDRGFLFSDAVYEVFKLHGDFLFTEAEHMARLRKGLTELRIDQRVADAVPSIVRELARRNRLMNSEAYAYIQISRGSAAPRAHAFSVGRVVPTVYVIVRPYKMADKIAGSSAIIEADQRWGRCDIKSTSLLANILANTRAREAGAYEALFTRSQRIVEASHSNVFAVVRGGDGSYSLVTPPLDNILPGVTRALILRRAPLDVRFLQESGMSAHAVREGHIEVSGITDGTIVELFCTASTSFIAPITHVVGVGDIGNGSVGRVAIALRAAWLRWWDEDRAVV